MKKYEDEVITVKVNISLCFILICIVYTLMQVFYQYNDGDFGIIIFLIIIALGGMTVISFGYCIIFNIINAKRNQKIANEVIKNGIKLKGEILEVIKAERNDFKDTFFKKAAYFRKFPSFERGAVGKTTIYYFLKVKYTHDGNVHIVKSPSLNFEAEEIISNNVDVYLYDDKIYIDNILFNEKEILNKDKEKNNMKKSIIIIAIIIAVLTWIVYIFMTLKIINFTIAIFLFGILFVVFCGFILVWGLKYISKI